MTIEQILDTIAPQFSTVINRADFITIAIGRISCTMFGDRYNLAVALRTAHDMTVAGVNNGSNGFAYNGLITSEREGDLSRTFGTNGGSANNYSDLLTTSYGNQLYGLIKGCIPKVMVVT